MTAPVVPPRPRRDRRLGRARRPPRDHRRCLLRAHQGRGRRGGGPRRAPRRHARRDAAWRCSAGAYDLMACVAQPWEVASGVILEQIHAAARDPRRRTRSSRSSTRSPTRTATSSRPGPSAARTTRAVSAARAGSGGPRPAARTARRSSVSVTSSTSSKPRSASQASIRCDEPLRRRGAADVSPTVVGALEPGRIHLGLVVHQVGGRAELLRELGEAVGVRGVLRADHEHDVGASARSPSRRPGGSASRSRCRRAAGPGSRGTAPGGSARSRSSRPPRAWSG